MILSAKFLKKHPLVDYGVVYGHHEGEEKKGVVWVRLNANENNDVFLGSMHGEWNENYGGYDNEKNIEAIKKFFRLKNRDDGRKNVHFVLLGDFNSSFEKIRDLSTKFQFRMEKHPMKTSTSDGQSPDHYAVSKNVRVKSEPTLCVNEKYDHKWLENMEFVILN